MVLGDFVQLVQVLVHDDDACACACACSSPCGWVEQVMVLALVVKLVAQ